MLPGPDFIKKSNIDYFLLALWVAALNAATCLSTEKRKMPDPEDQSHNT